MLLKFLKERDLKVHKSKHTGKWVLYQGSQVMQSTHKTTKTMCTEMVYQYFTEEGDEKSKQKYLFDHAAATDLVYSTLSEEAVSREERRQEEKAKLASKWDNLHGDYEGPRSPMELWRLMPLRGGTDEILFDPSAGCQIDIDMKFYLEEWTAYNRMNGVQKPSTDFARTARFTSYHSPDPTSKKLELKKDELIGPYYHINTYEKPTWMTDYHHCRTTAQIPSLVKKLMDHLFINNQPTIDRVYDWMANSLFFMDPIMLCLVSPGEGLGKTLAVDLCGALHSRTRYHKPPSDVLTGIFNHSLYGKSLILFDEINAVGPAKENLRKLIGNETTTRKMNSDQGMKLDQPISWAATTNVARHLGIEGRGRRFFVPNITNERLDLSLTNAEINTLGDYAKAFTKDVNEECREEMAKFGWFLYHRFVDGIESSRAALENIKPLNFWHCQKACMNQWQQAVLETFLYDIELNEDGTCQYYSIQDLRESLDEIPPRFLPNYSDLVDFITNHEWRGAKLANVEETRVLKENIIKPIVHKSFEYELSVFDEEEEEELL